MHAWVNGQLLEDPHAPAIGVTDHGLTVGDGVFEAIKVVDGRPFALTRHLARLGRSAAALGLPAPDLEVFRAAVAEVLAQEHLPLGRIRITYTGGPAPLGSGRGDASPRWWSSPRRWIRPPRPPRWRGCRGRATSAGRWPASSPRRTPRTWSRSRRPPSTARARRSSRTSPATCARGPAPTSATWSAGEVRTPTLAAGCLAGVTRALLLEWSDVVEVDEPIEVLDSADEIFLMSTTRDVQGVHRLDDRDCERPGRSRGS